MTVQWETDLPSIVRASHGLEVVLGDLGTMHKVRSEITDGRMVVIEHSLPPSRLAAPLHRHSREDEISYVLAGQMGALLGDRVIQARAGSYVVKPRGQWHTYWNAGEVRTQADGAARPRRLRRLSGAAGGSPGRSRTARGRHVERIGAEYGVEFDFASVSDICQHFGVTSGPPGLSAGPAVTQERNMVSTIQSVALGNDVTLEYAEQGDPGGIPVICLHGVTDSYRSFDPVLPLLPKSFTRLPSRSAAMATRRGR